MFFAKIMKEYIIYIPGLGDHYDGLRQRSLSLWRIFGVTTKLVPMQWYDGMPLSVKRQAVQKVIDAAIDNGYRVSLVGESAGASLALAIFSSDDRLHRLVTLCGVIDAGAAVSPRIYQRSPGFEASMSELASIPMKQLDIQRIAVITSFIDPVVNQRTNIIAGVKPLRIPSIGHFVTIALCLTIFSWVVVRQVKK